MMTNQSSRGSEWEKWDLHVHSPYSKGFTGTWEQFEQQLKNADCEVVGINDYFSIEGYKKAKDKIDNGALKLGLKKILPVVEFRMRDVLKNRHTGKSGFNINFHVIFDDSLLTSKIETFIKSLKVDGRQIGDKYSDPDFLKETAKVYFETDVLDELKHNPDFQDKYIVLLPYDEYGGIGDIDPNSDDWIKKGFIREAHVLGSSNKNQIDFFLWKPPLDGLGKEKFTQEQFAEWFGRKKPCIKGSDSHSHTYPIGKLQDTDSNPTEKFCWIKAEPTFEGLKQIIYDPESRVYIGEKSPIAPTNIVESITFNTPRAATISVKQKDGSPKEEPFCFAGLAKTYNFSPFFNCFIGGRGSGKSTILNFLGQHSEEPDSSHDFWEKLKPSFDTADRKYFSFSGIETFEFIGQSEVESFATNKEAFTNAIYERANSLSDGLLKKDETKLAVLLKRIQSFKTVIENINELEQTLIDKEKEKKTIENSVTVTKSQEYSDIVVEITLKSNQRQDLESWRTAVDDLRASISELEEQFEDSDTDDTSVVDRGSPVADRDEEEDVSRSYREAYAQAQASIDKAAEFLEQKNFKALVKRETELAKEIEGHEKDLSSLLKKAGLSEENILQVKSAPQKLVRIIDDLQKLEKKIADRKSELEKYGDVLEETQRTRANYEGVINESIRPLIDTLRNQARENKNENIKNIGLSYFFDEDHAWKEIANEFYAYFAEHHKDRERGDLVKDYICKNKEVFSDEHKKLIKQLSKEEKQAGYLKFLKDVFSIPLNFMVFRTIRDKHLNDVSKFKRIQVLYDGRDIEHASFGQKCTAVMVILLLFGNYPLVIDEPEAHLDSSLIANYLVPLIKRKKTNRQIVFATHNANFVINGDSEKIFILKNETGATEITETTIENLEHRDELLRLEGGRDAFKRRGEKLHISGE